MRISLLELATLLGGEARGRADIIVTSVRALDEADGNAISPYFRARALDNLRDLPGAVLAPPMLAARALEKGIAGAVVHAEPPLALARAIDLFFPTPSAVFGVHETAFVDPSASVHQTAWVGPFVTIEAEVTIGEGSFIGPHAVIGSRTAIGCGVRIGPGAVIGADGFGFVPAQGEPVKMRHIGRVVIEDGVEIGANTCVDRATLGTTFIGRGSKLDNLVQVGHNARIGRGALIAGQCGLAGSACIGDGAMLGGQAGVGQHVRIGAQAKVAGKSGVTTDVAEKMIVAGYPAMPRARWLKAWAVLLRLARREKQLEVK